MIDWLVSRSKCNKGELGQIKRFCSLLMLHLEFERGHFMR
jgi:hypothetical protein